ncbi:cytochrome P450 [Infundibulicybe gibba]|nr:cytochrome P450 [Infundibulicybe gibba]
MPVWPLGSRPDFFPPVSVAMISLDLLASAASFSLILYLYAKRPKSSYTNLPLPPGPKKKFLIGNLLDMPTDYVWKTYHQWCKDFGAVSNTDIIHLEVAGTSIVVLDTYEATTELFEKKSSLYSGRARMPMINELMGWDFNFPCMPYGDRWRQHRRIMHQAFHPTAARRFHPHEIRATHNLLRRLLDDPNDYMVHLRHMAGSTIMSIAYGLDVLPKDDPYIATAERAVHPMVAAAVPGTFLVDSFPFLKYVPEWMPGAGFQKKAKEWRKLSQAMVEAPFRAAMAKIDNGEATPSFVSYNMQCIDEDGDVDYQKSVIQSTAGALYTAGSDTTVSAIASCILGLLENPDVQRKAQQEIDSVVGHGHLPDFEDEPSLPFITAIVKETMRWRDVVPIAIPHLLEVDDVYKGYRIPAGTICIPNAWAMLHDETIYPDPFSFRPERFMKDGNINPEVRDPAHATFGFGRRICPGRYMAYSAIWIAIASILAVFDIEKITDENGNIIEPSHEYISALICMPLPFKCSIKPRSKEAEVLIRATANMGE